jgi:hypothetical protein
VRVPAGPFRLRCETVFLDRLALVGVSSLKEMLAESFGADSTRHRKFAEPQAKHGSDLTQFWQRCVPLG